MSILHEQMQNMSEWSTWADIVHEWMRLRWERRRVVQCMNSTKEIEAGIKTNLTHACAITVGSTCNRDSTQ